jgi:hypothetical protein
VSKVRKNELKIWEIVSKARENELKEVRENQSEIPVGTLKRTFRSVA